MSRTRNVDMDNVQVRHFHYGKDRSVNEGVVTVAYDDKRNFVHCGIAWCSPKDNFCKKKGRDKAIGRLRSQKHCYSVSTHGQDAESAIVMAINTQEIERPQWAIDLQIEMPLNV